MAKYDTKDIRNVALVGHTGSGKTSLAEALLFKFKASARLGSVEDGTTVLDFEPEEKERKHSIDLGVASCSVQGRELNLLDAPGYSDFAGEAVCALNAVETAVLCVNAADGIRVNTTKMWELSGKLGVARVIVINKMDADNVRYAELVAALREAFGKSCVPVQVPAGAGDGFKGVVSLLTGGTEAVPAELKDLANEALEKLLENDDELLEKYLGGHVPTGEELTKALPHEIADGTIVPILCASAKKDVGVSEVAEFLARFAPPPGPMKAKDPQGGDVEVKPGSPFSARVFKSIADPFVHRQSYLRIYSGTLAADHPIRNQRTGKSSRAGALFKPFGKEHRGTGPFVAGDIVCVTKVDDLNTGDTVCDHPVTFPRFEFPASMVSLAVEPKTKQDLARMSESMHKMADSGTGELVIHGRSKLHVDTILARLKRKFDVHVITHPPKLALKETILSHSEGHHKHKKQSGGHGQYGEVYLRLKPTPRGEGFRFTDSITQGRIPQQYVPPIEKGIRKTIEKGVVAGFPVVDVEVEVYDGSYHDVDSGPASFELAGSRAFKEAFAKAKPVLLEPIVHIEITVPTKYTGGILSDLPTKRAQVENQDSLPGDLAVISGIAPLSEMARYKATLDSITAGTGSYSMSFSHYERVPANVQQNIVKNAKVAADEEE
jgi:elongation factor G